jgi:cystathionine beta-lyase
MGALVTEDKSLADQIRFIQNASGAVPGPQDCFLVLRGIKTLHLRMQRHCENGAAVANFLTTVETVDKVLWPGFKDNRNHNIARKQMRDFGGMISFSLKENTEAAATEVLKKFKLFTLAESLGGVESLIGHPATMTHASIPKEEREKVGLVDSLIRLSVGVEDIDDLVADLKQALA